MNFYQAPTYLPFWLSCGMSFFLSACIGSFLNVIIYRIPIGPAKRSLGISFNINTPRSHCPVCQHQLAWYENIPVVSWMIQRAKCRNCKTVIPFRYPAIELLVAVIGTAFWYTTESWPVALLAVTMSMTFIPTAWWVITMTAWNKSMWFWLVFLLLASMLLGGYVWTTK